MWLRLVILNLLLFLLLHLSSIFPPTFSCIPNHKPGSILKGNLSQQSDGEREGGKVERKAGRKRETEGRVGNEGKDCKVEECSWVKSGGG